MVPTGDVEAEALNVVGVPATPGLALKAAVGAWSGVMATPSGLLPTVMALPAVLVAVAIGVTLPEATVSATYTVLPSGVMATSLGLFPAEMGDPTPLVAVLIGVTVPELKLLT